jgi:ferritin
MKPSIQQLINNQIAYEQDSSRLYLAMSSWCERKGFRGFAHWLRVQSVEENNHAMKLITFLLDRGGTLELAQLRSPAREYKSLTDVFEQALEHELSITAHISTMFELARQEKDYATEIALQWYVTEQVEEEANFGHVLEQLRSIGEKSSGVWYMDSKMGKRGS